MKKLVLSLLLSSVVAMNAFGMEPHKENPNNPKKANSFASFCKTAAGTYATVYGLAFAHEFGHLLAAKLCGARNMSIGVNPLRPYSGKFSADINVATSPAQWALIGLAGPVVGIASCYSFLKLLNIADEYKKGATLSQSIIKGLKKSAVTKERSPLTLLATAGMMFLNFQNLFPTSDMGTDGSRLFKQLSIPNPAQNNDLVGLATEWIAPGLLTGALMYSCAEKKL